MNLPPHKLLTYLMDNDNFVIVTHLYPDGDTLGSGLALCEALEKLGKKAVVYNKHKVPESLMFLPGSIRVKGDEIIDRHTGKMDDSTQILVDVNNAERTGLDGISFYKTIVIDHHLTQSNYGDIRWIDPTASATAILIYRLIKTLDVAITHDMAINLYTGICVDTGTFRYSNTTHEAMAIGTELMKAGAEPAYVTDKLYNNWNEPKFLLMREMLNTMEIHNCVAISVVTLNMFEKTGANRDDTENLVNLPLMVNGINISAFYREREKDSWKVSLRSKGNKNVAYVAADFGGGGHRNAAGFTYKGNIVQAKAKLVSLLQDKV
ncbi:MAG: bifunctional oligoribonuclease/PAP phosphatase NrnA [Candidatus Magnetoovum sp. WYHC-5]|nr:bifunctional oligoribonuclease/PAP phosphatase NrnA [Candidatus Magnetoovum sp. WYHC-5]